MKKPFILPFLFLILSFIILAYGYYLGEVSIGLLVIFPLITTNGLVGVIGVILFIISIFIIFIQIPKSIFHSDAYNNRENIFNVDKKVDKKVQAGGVIFLGPIPIIFGNNRNVIKYMIYTSIIMILLIIIYASLLLNE